MKRAVAYDAVRVAEREGWVLQYLPLVSYVIGRLTIALPPHLDRNDLFSEGVYGLIHAARTYDPSKGASFKAHAYTRIRGAILDEIRRADPIPKQQRERLRALEAAYARLTSENGYPPSLDELSQATGFSPEALDALMVLARSLATISLDASLTGDTSLAECVRSPRIDDDPAVLAERDELLKSLAEAVASLPEREREVIGLYYHEGLLLREIGELLGISESRVCQIHARAIYLLNRELSRRRGPEKRGEA